jgi:DNA-binding MarR family transcriptional regulator
MTQQLELGQAYARTTDPETSHAAAESVKGSEATRLEAMVVMALVKRENKAGLTTHEIAKVTGLEYGSVTPRIRPLVKKGWIMDSGERRIPEGRTKAGIVWRAV